MTPREQFTHRRHIKDIISLMGLNPRGEGAREVRRLIHPQRKRGDQRPLTCYTDEFQTWFNDGVRVCEKHPYPFVWHIITGLKCRRCADCRPKDADAESPACPVEPKAE
jgi:hypothetical protein